MKTKTPEEIQEEIAKLKACKNYVPCKNIFGDDNHRNIDLQIEELSAGIDDTADEWEDFLEYEQSSIMEARDWAEGQLDESPSSGWDHLKK